MTRRTAGGGTLREHLTARIAREGPLSFADYMQVALYDPSHGYYASAPAEPDGYFTSVTVHPGLFGAMLGRHITDVWQALDRPNPFRIVELGAADGSLARQMLAVAPHHPWAATVEYIGVEISAARRARAAAAAPGARFVAALAAIPPGPAMAAISNEFFDALPVRALRRAATGWVEERVGLAEPDFTFVDAPAPPDAIAYAERYATAMPLNGRFEMRTEVANVYARLASLAGRCIVTTIDYGGTAADVHGPRLAAGTLLAYRRHTASEAALNTPGDMDLTAHVNFTELHEAGAAAGFASAALTTQAEFLAALGIGEYLQHLQQRPDTTPASYARAREAVFQLVAPTDLGRFRVLVQARGARLDGLRGLTQARPHL
ncbi:MAG: SAM-dependent methyltransferase [Actinobacteria bacterium]|nr:SAM-dependent methyltransferase [Actinomycetota bacterium]